jgi:replicative superfamily II helicase
VPLIEGVLDRRGIFQYVDVDGSTKLDPLLSPNEVIQRRDKQSSQDVIVPLAKKLIANNEKLLIFRNMRGPAQGCAKYLSRELGIAPAVSILDSLPNHDLTGASNDLRECLRGGTAFHNTNLLKAEREAVEKGFRNSNGGIFALTATTTLAAGINTPASTVILAENEFVGEDGRAFTIAEYKNMAGRAGRLGYNETGKSIILADTPIERARLFQKYILGTPEEVRSSFQSKDLSTWILRLLSQVQALQANDVPSLLINTFGGYTASRGNPDWAKAIEIQIQRLLDRMVNADLAIKEGDKLRLTNLGRACAVSSLSFESALRLVELMRTTNITQVPPKHILAVVQVLEEADSIYTPVMKRGQSESVRLSDVISRYGRNMVTILQRYNTGQFTLWERCKRATIIWDWINGDSIESLERRYSPTPFQGTIQYGDIVRIAEGTRLHLRSAQQILAAVFPENSDFLTAIDEILLRLEFGLPSNAIQLTKLDVPLIRGQYLTLSRNGCKTVQDVRTLSKKQLEEYLGVASATLLFSKTEFPSQEGMSEEAIINQSNA